MDRTLIEPQNHQHKNFGQNWCNNTFLPPKTDWEITSDRYWNGSLFVYCNSVSSTIAFSELAHQVHLILMKLDCNAQTTNYSSIYISEVISQSVCGGRKGYYTKFLQNSCVDDSVVPSEFSPSMQAFKEACKCSITPPVHRLQICLQNFCYIP